MKSFLENGLHFVSHGRLSFLPLFFVWFFYSCQNDSRPISFSGEIQGTYYQIKYYDKQKRNLQTSIDSILHQFDLTASLWVKNSLISRINNNDTGVCVNADFIKLFEESERIYRLTNGAFDPSIGAIINLWGFGSHKPQGADKEWIDSLKQFSKFENLKLIGNRIHKNDMRVQFDFNAIAQGYSVDLVGAYLYSQGIHNFLIDIGGELLASGYKSQHQPWVIGIEKPQEDALYGKALQTKVTLHNKAIATSGSYRKYYEKNGVKYSHTIDPKTGFPVTHHLLSASVIAPDCTSADAIATALMVMGTDKAIAFTKQHPEYQVFLISDDENGGYSVFSTIGAAEN
jgi:thiamine biosynthesis lipoprotein